MRSTFNIGFVCRPSKVQKSGLAPVEMTIVINKLPSVTPIRIYGPCYCGQLFDFECFYRGVAVARDDTSAIA